MPDRTVLWWIKKDFRLTDNPALHDALAAAEQVVPVFLFEPAVLRAEETSAFHVHAWLTALDALGARLRVVGGGIALIHDDAVSAFDRLHAALPFDAIYSHEEIGTALTYARDRAVRRWCRDRGVDWHETPQTAVFRGLADRDQRSHRWREWMARPTLAEPGEAALRKTRLPDTLAAYALDDRNLQTELLGFPLPSRTRTLLQPVSEPAALETLDSFLHDRGIGYAGGISSPNTAFVRGSRLSVHLAWGTITGRHVYQATQRRIDELAGDDTPEAKQWRRSLFSFKSRLHWRDHFIQRLESETEMEFRPLHPAYAALPYENDPALFDAWIEARTGFPLVDACMRCAQTTGFLNFRMRAMLTSVACHTLHLGWDRVMYPMARLWADYEPGIHISQLQMQAGVIGINTLRTYNPAKQIADHDPQAAFVKRWLPELRDVAPEALIAHQEDPLPTYPAPVVDWRERTRAMRRLIGEIKRRKKTRALTEIVLDRHGSRRSPRRQVRVKPRPATVEA